MASSPSATTPRRGLLRSHLDDQLYRTGYYLIIGTGITSLLGVAFWAIAAHSYSAHEVGQNAAAISAMTLVSGVCSLGLSAVVVRYLPIAGTADKRLVVASYGLTTILSLIFGAVVAATSSLWSPTLDFLQEPGWLVGFTLATAATTVFTLSGQRPHRPAGGALDPAGELALCAGKARAAHLARSAAA